LDKSCKDTVERPIAKIDIYFANTLPPPFSFSYWAATFSLALINFSAISCALSLPGLNTSFAAPLKQKIDAKFCCKK
jgi:hypothetical protein